ncbi:MAG: hypothetical protein ACOCP8_05980 [archaeon]
MGIEEFLNMLIEQDWDRMFKFAKENDILPEKYPEKYYYEWVGQYSTEARETYPARLSLIGNISNFILEEEIE